MDKIRNIALIVFIALNCFAASRQNFSTIRLVPAQNPTTTGNLSGDIFYDSDDNKLKYYDGTSYKTIQDTASVLGPNSVTTVEILDSTILSADISTGGVESSDILDNTISTVDILDSTIISADILNESITTNDILDGTILSPDIATAVNLIRSETNTLGIEYFATTDVDCAASPCTLSYNSAGISSVTRSGTGAYTVNFTGAAFSSNVLCIMNAGRAGVRLCQVDQPAAECTQSSCNIVCITISGAPGTIDADPHGICIGVR